MSLAVLVKSSKQSQKCLCRLAHIGQFRKAPNLLCFDGNRKRRRKRRQKRRSWMICSKLLLVSLKSHLVIISLLFS